MKNSTDRLTDVLEQGVDWRTRTVYIIGEINDEKTFRLVPVIRLLDETKGPIKVFLSSNGGDEAAGFAIFDSLKLAKNKVVIVGYGGIYSIAALIFQAGDRRLLAPNAQVMMHNGTMNIGSESLDSNKVEQLGREAAQNNARYHKAIADRIARVSPAESALCLREVERWCKNERYFLAEEAVSEGLADGLIEHWSDQ